MKTALNATADTFSIKSIYTDFLEITKARLAISVVFSSVAGFMLGIPDFQSLEWSILAKIDQTRIEGAFRRKPGRDWVMSPQSKQAHVTGLADDALRELWAVPCFYRVSL